MNRMITMLSTAIAVLSLSASVPIPPEHEAYLERGIIAIVHWGLNTYTEQEWGFGNAKPEIIQPTDYNPAQWVEAMKAGGIRAVVIVAKHHDGFCLWPSKYNQEYSTAAIPGKFKNMNVVKDVEVACRQAGLEFGVYISPWDRHQGNYGQPEYVQYFLDQWNEMFSGEYGTICEIWLDGANGGTGWYGGVNGDKGEKRTIPMGYYRKKELLANLVKHNPMGVAFGGYADHSAIWCGNERGIVPDNWAYDCGGPSFFMPPEADTPFRGTWFFRADKPAKPLKQLVNCYFESVGRGGVLNWGIAPDKTGRVCDEDVKRLKEFGDYVRKFNAIDFAKGAKIEQSAEGNKDAVTLTLTKSVAFNAVEFAEDLSKGQLVEEWTIEVFVGGAWKEVAKGTKAGYRRIARFDAVKSDKVRISCIGKAGQPKIVRPAVRYAAQVKDTGEVEYGETDTAKWMDNGEYTK